MKQTISTAQEKSFSRLNKMINQNGIVQHCKLDKPDFEHPASIDDVARTAIIYAREKEFKNEKNIKVLFDYMKKAKRKDGFVNNYRNWDGEFIGRDGKKESPEVLHDCFGRYLWALSEIADSNYFQKQKAKELFLDSIHTSYELNYPMSNALTIIGLSKFPDENHCPSHKIMQINNYLSYGLLKEFKENSDENWKGFSNEYTYCASRPAQAMILAGDKLKHRELIRIGIKSLDFLIKKNIREGMFYAIGNQGFFKKDQEIPSYDQQPIEAGVMVEGLIDTYKITGEEKYLDNAKTCFSWFHGNNINTVKMVAENGGVYDGITKLGVNLNQGAEPIISYLSALSKFKEIDVDPFDYINH